MTEREKIIRVLRDNIEYELRDYPDNHYVGVTFNYGVIADALIEAGIGDADVAKRALGKACEHIDGVAETCADCVTYRIATRYELVVPNEQKVIFYFEKLEEEGKDEYMR